MGAENRSGASGSERPDTGRGGRGRQDTLVRNLGLGGRGRRGRSGRVTSPEVGPRRDGVQGRGVRSGSRRSGPPGVGLPLAGVGPSTLSPVQVVLTEGSLCTDKRQVSFVSSIPRTKGSPVPRSSPRHPVGSQFRSDTPTSTEPGVRVRKRPPPSALRRRRVTGVRSESRGQREAHPSGSPRPTRRV